MGCRKQLCRGAAGRVLQIVGAALEGTGLNVLGSSPIEAYDALAPPELRSQALMPGARGVVVVGSAGRELWLGFGREVAAAPSLAETSHPLDDHVARVLDHADVALGRAGVGSRRFEARVSASPSLDFRALGEMAGLGERGPFGMLIHETHGPWWALRGAWLVDALVDGPRPHVPPCAGCAAPCVGGARTAARGVELATAGVRGRCIVGQASRYEDEQIAYHYGRDAHVSGVRIRTS